MLIFGIGAIIATIINYGMYINKKDFTIPLALALAFTSLVSVSEYSLAAKWVEANDMAALYDVVIYMDNPLWILTLASIFLNLLPLFLSKRKKHHSSYESEKKES